jgi:hypothetical protein
MLIKCGTSPLRGFETKEMHYAYVDPERHCRMRHRRRCGTFVVSAAINTCVCGQAERRNKSVQENTRLLV